MNSFLQHTIKTNADYIIAVNDALEHNRAVIAAWLNTRCNECQEIPGDNDQYHLLAYDPHTCDAVVIIGCEGYQQVNPNAVGIDSPDWQDWTPAKPQPFREMEERHGRLVPARK